MEVHCSCLHRCSISLAHWFRKETRTPQHKAIMTERNKNISKTNTFLAHVQPGLWKTLKYTSMHHTCHYKPACMSTCGKTLNFSWSASFLCSLRSWTSSCSCPSMCKKIQQLLNRDYLLLIYLRGRGSSGGATPADRQRSGRSFRRGDDAAARPVPGVRPYVCGPAMTRVSDLLYTVEYWYIIYVYLF